MKVREMIWALTQAPLDSEVYILLNSDIGSGADEADIASVLYDPETNVVFVMEALDDTPLGPETLN